MGTPEDVEVAVIEGVAAEVPVWVMEDVWVTPPVPVRVAAAVCDVVEVEVTGIGVLRNSVVAEA